MSVRYGGKQGQVRNTKIRDVGTYLKILQIEDKQCMMSFSEEDIPVHFI